VFHTPPHKVAPHLPQAGQIVNDAFAHDPRVIVNEPELDVTVAGHGSVFIVSPISPAAREWVNEFLPSDAIRWAGGIAVEARYVADIVDGMRDAGLKVA